MSRHIPVLQKESVTYLSINPTDTIVDGTVGSGGHARAICAQLGAEGLLVGIDKDQAAIDQARESLDAADCADYCLRTDSFANADTVVDNCGCATIGGALLDLGFRSEQLAVGRGFSFQEEAPLIMTYEQPSELEDDDLTAKEIVNEWSRESLEKLLTGYANERFSEAIADQIHESRQANPITTTTDLVSVIEQALPSGYNSNKHPATRTFQALRMAVNDEVRTLEIGLETIFSLLADQGRLVVISFHSVEDRITKQYFSDLADNNKGEVVTDTPVRPQESEVSFNPRARSAKLRCFEKHV